VPVGDRTTGHLSVLPPESRFSSISALSYASSAKNTQSIEVRQLFTPILPGELSVTRTGELLVILDSFDDEWCAVGRERPGSDGLELGVVPLWVFLKPVEGVESERPMRTTSLAFAKATEKR
jgi:hypothetical protein